MDTNQIDAFITTSADGFDRIYNTINPPAVVVPAVNPIVYTTQQTDVLGNPIGGAQVGADLGSVLLIGAVIFALWYLTKR